MNLSEEKISYIEAKNRGLNKYFTGIPCKKGHIDKRNVLTRSCYACIREREKKSHIKANKKKYRIKNAQNIRIKAWKRMGIKFESHDEALMWFAKSTTFCQSCRRTAKETGSKNGYLCLDHDHKTGKPRAILCFSCNSFEGTFSLLCKEQKQMVLDYFKGLS